MQTILYVIYDNISLHSITQSLCFSMRHYIARAFSQFVVARIHFCLMMVYYLYTTMQNI